MRLPPACRRVGISTKTHYSRTRRTHEPGAVSTTRRHGYFLDILVIATTSSTIRSTLITDQPHIPPHIQFMVLVHNEASAVACCSCAMTPAVSFFVTGAIFCANNTFGEAAVTVTIRATPNTAKMPRRVLCVACSPVMLPHRWVVDLHPCEQRDRGPIGAAPRGSEWDMLVPSPKRGLRLTVRIRTIHGTIVCTSKLPGESPKARPLIPDGDADANAPVRGEAQELRIPQDAGRVSELPTVSPDDPCDVRRVRGLCARPGRRKGHGA